MFNFKQFRSLSKEELKEDVLAVATSIGIAPVMAIRRLLKLEDFTKHEIKQIVEEELPPPDYLKDTLKIALQNDPVFSPKGIRYSKLRGKKGEDLIAEWLDSLSIGYDRDLGQGGPDHLLKSPLRVDISGTIKEFDWIESKASYGDAFELKRNHKQFDRYEFFGNGLIFYWYGAELTKKYEIFTWESLVNRVNHPLKDRIISFISFVPQEFKHLIS